MVIIDRSSEAADLRDLVFFTQSAVGGDGDELRTTLKKIRLTKRAGVETYH